MPKKQTKTTRPRIKSKRPKGIRAVRPEEFRRIMDRLDLIGKEVEKEKELFDIKIKSLRLEKEYLWNIIKPKKRKIE